MNLSTLLGAAQQQTTLGAGSAYADEIRSDSPFAYYRMEDLAGTTLTEDGGNYDGTLVNTPTLGVTGQVDNAIDFESANNEYATLTTMGSLWSTIDTTGFSFEFWINTTSTSSHVVSGFFNTGSNTAWRFRINTDNTQSASAGGLAFFTRDEDADSNWGGSDSPATWNDGNWHHIVYTRSTGSTPTNIIYVDGSAQTTTQDVEVPQTNFANAGFVVALAANNSRGSIQSYLDGSLDEVAFYDTELSSTQVSDHYNAA